MALLAGPPRGPFGELALVEIAVTVGALGKFQSPAGAARFMAGFALHLAMLAFQGEAGFIMIEAGLIDLIPSRGAVATGAIEPELPFVHILVTIGAGGKFGHGKLQERGIIGKAVVGHAGVAFFAGHITVFAGKDEASLIVVESRRGFPGIHIMAAKAVFFHLPPMFVVMTTEAILLQAQKGLFEIFLLLEQHSLVGNIGRFMAVAAL